MTAVDIRYEIISEVSFFGRSPNIDNKYGVPASESRWFDQTFAFFFIFQTWNSDFIFQNFSRIFMRKPCLTFQN